MTYDMIATIDAEWITRNAPKVFDLAAAELGLEFDRGMENFIAMLDEVGLPNPDKRELFRSILDGRYKLVRYFGLGGYQTPQTTADLMADNDVALYDLHLDPEEMTNLADPKNPGYDEGLLAGMSAKLNALIKEEIGEDAALFVPTHT